MLTFPYPLFSRRMGSRLKILQVTPGTFGRNAAFQVAADASRHANPVILEGDHDLGASLIGAFAMNDSFMAVHALETFGQMFLVGNLDGNMRGNLPVFNDMALVAHFLFDGHFFVQPYRNSGFGEQPQTTRAMTGFTFKKGVVSFLHSLDYCHVLVTAGTQLGTDDILHFISGSIRYQDH